MIGTVSHCDWRTLAGRIRSEVGQVDLLATDCPYSERTHSGHDDGAMDVNRGADARARLSKPGRLIKHGDGYRRAVPSDTAPRRRIPYAHWSETDVAAFVGTWRDLVSGWWVSLTDHVLAPAWERHLEAAGLYVFAPIACVEPGSRCRLLGDGPAQWSSFAIVARPRSASWLAKRKEVRHARGEKCALPGAYQAHEHGKDVPGGKPLALMEALVRDYSEPGDLVCDPCCGAGTTLLAAQLTGRRYIGGDIDASHVAIAEERLRALPTADRKGTLPLPWGGQ